MGRDDSESTATTALDARGPRGDDGALGGSTGVEWIVDAFGCDPERLRSRAVLEALFDRAVLELGLHPVAPAAWHAFPAPGGVTGMLLLAESHLSCHTFPETRYAAIDLYCCRARDSWDFDARLREHLGATSVSVRVVPRGREPGR